MHEETINNLKFEEEFQKEYQKLQEEYDQEKLDKAFQIEMGRQKDPDLAMQEAKRNLEIDPRFYDDVEV